MTAPARQPASPPPVADVVLDDIIVALEATLARRDAAIEGFVTLVAELKADNVAIHARLDRLFAPEQPPEGYIALRKAAAMIGRSDEYLRQRAARGEIDAEIVAGKWYVNIGVLALPNKIAT
jgi:hypothetical protein